MLNLLRYAEVWHIQPHSNMITEPSSILIVTQENTKIVTMITAIPREDYEIQNKA